MDQTIVILSIGGIVYVQTINHDGSAETRPEDTIDVIRRAADHVERTSESTAWR